MIRRINTWIRDHFRNLHENSLWIKSEKRHYYVGDIAPDNLLNRDPNSPGLGAMISVDPETKRIMAIFIP